MSGKALKSYNQFYNKRKAKLTSLLAKCNKDVRWSNQLQKLSKNRENWVENYLNQSVSIIVKYCYKYGVSTVVVGYNKQWKTEVNIGKVNNQKFTSIPHEKLLRKLKYKCEENGIKLVETEESYTSKCSFLDCEEIAKNREYVGKRVKRGLFRASSGVFVNADLNGAGNILRKVFSDISLSEIEEIAVFIVKPLVYNPISQWVVTQKAFP